MKKLTIQEMRKIASTRKGKCLSKEYVNNRTNLLWECKKGHTWEANPDHIKRGAWCLICSQNVSERICRQYFEIIFKKEFPKARPSWLRSPKGIPMELDGFCEKIGLAFEYQGQQHYSQGYFYKTKGDINLRRKYDLIKKRLCKKNGVQLIQMPYKIDYEEMPTYIKKEAKKRKIQFPRITLYINHKYFDIYPEDKLKEMQKLAKKNDGKCLSKQYINSESKLKWQCKEGHIWTANSEHIKQGRWCPFCAGKIKLTIEEMQKLAKIRGGKCLSKKYVNIKTKLNWKCKQGHIWKSTPLCVKNLHAWCPSCAMTKVINMKRATIEEMQKIATSKKGICLSKKYINNHSKLLWQCKERHRWKARPHDIKRGSWCPKCAINTRIKTIYGK